MPTASLRLWPGASGIDWLIASKNTFDTGNAKMEYAASDLSQRERYKVLTSFVLPRPIG